MKKILHMKMLSILTYDKHFSKALSQFDLDSDLLTKLPKIFVTRNF